MAGRPATVRSGQSNMIGLIVFVILTCIFLALFILQLTSNKDLQNEVARADKKMREYGNPPGYYAQEARARNSNAFAVMVDDARRVAELVTGSTDDLGVTVANKCEQAIADIAGRNDSVNPTDTVLSALSTVDRLYTEERRRAGKLQSDYTGSQQEVASLNQQLKTTREEFEQKVNELSQRLRQNEEDKIRALQQKDEQLAESAKAVAALEQQVLRNERDTRAAVRDYEINIGLLETQVASLEDQLRSLKQTSFDPNAILTKADGKILRSVPGSDIVYINLGAADKIRIGMRFEVFSRTAEPTRQLRGKASLEVATVMEDTAECRVMRRTSGHPIIDGDVVVNIAFERNRKPKFVVRGEFDLDYDGIADVDGMEQVHSLIREWGGQVVDDLDESVDFVVVGQSPGVPSFPDDRPVSDIVRDQVNRKELEGVEFIKLIDRAASMYIPVITQNQFLYLTGYAGDTALTRR